MAAEDSEEVKPPRPRRRPSAKAAPKASAAPQPAAPEAPALVEAPSPAVISPPPPPTEKPSRHRHRLRTLVTVLITTVVVSPLAFYLGALFEFHAGPQLDSTLAPIFFSQPVKALDFGTLDQIWQIIVREYARKDPNPQAAFDGAGKGLVGALNGEYGDRFSDYLTPAELQRNKEFLAGAFGGIGASMSTQNGPLTVTAVLPNTPAQRAGLKAGDIVTKVDGKSTTGLSVDVAVALVRGKVGTHVHLTVQRGSADMDLDIVRENIIIPSVHSTDIKKGVLYVRIFDFGEKTSADFETALQNGINRGDKSIILDLRQNPGGFVNTADDVTSEFVKPPALNVTVVDRNGKKEEHSVTGHGIAFTQKLVVLVDEQTASAAEIVSGALKDNQRALALIGKKTFGKGSVQTDFSLRNGGDLHLTIAYWYTPSGKSIEKNGITPDKDVGLDKPENMYQVDQLTSDPAKDAQLTAALALL